MSNGFNINEQEYQKIIHDDGYFKGIVVSTLNHIKVELNKQAQADKALFAKTSKCGRQGVKINIALIAAGVGIVISLGKVAWPYIGPVILKCIGL